MKQGALWVKLRLSRDFTMAEDPAIAAVFRECCWHWPKNGPMGHYLQCLREKAAQAVGFPILHSVNGEHRTLQSNFFFSCFQSVFGLIHPYFCLFLSTGRECLLYACPTILFSFLNFKGAYSPLCLKSQQIYRIETFGQCWNILRLWKFMEIQ